MEEAEVWLQQEIRWKRNAGASSGKICMLWIWTEFYKKLGAIVVVWAGKRYVLNSAWRLVSKLLLIEETDEERLL